MEQSHSHMSNKETHFLVVDEVLTALRVDSKRNDSLKGDGLVTSQYNKTTYPLTTYSSLPRAVLLETFPQTPSVRYISSDHYQQPLSLCHHECTKPHHESRR